MTNITLSLKQFDQVNKDLDVRDLYNQEDTFKLLKDYIEALSRGLMPIWILGQPRRQN